MPVTIGVLLLFLLLIFEGFYDLSVEDTWVHAARGLATELSFHSCNVLRDSRRGVPRANKNEARGT